MGEEDERTQKPHKLEMTDLIVFFIHSLSRRSDLD